MVSTGNNVTHIQVPQSELDSVTKAPGQLIYTTYTYRTYWDISSTERRLLSDVIILSTESEREDILAPLDKFYFVEDTNEFWRYDTNNGWVQLSNKKRVIDCGGP